MRTSVYLSSLIALVCGGCHIASPPQQLPNTLQPGARLYVYAPRALDCSVTTAATSGELIDGQGQLLNESGKFDKEPVPVNLTSVDAQGDWLLLRARPEVGEALWLRVPAGQVSPCLSTEPKAIAAAAARVGKSFAYTPWTQSCTSIQAVGTAANAILLESDPGQAFSVVGLTYGASSAKQLAARVGGATLWYKLNGKLNVRSDTFEGCFTETTGQAEAETPRLEALLSTPLSRCAATQDPRHVECRTTLGVWEGAIDQSFVAVEKRRRTLGTLHFFDGRPVEGRQFARTVVAFDVTPSEDGNVNDLARGLGGGIRQALAQQSEGEIRLARPDESQVTHRVLLGVSNLQFGELRQRDVRENSRYKSGENIIDNPAKPSAEERVRSAEQGLQQAQQEYEEDKQRLQEQKEAAIRACNEQKEQASGDAKKALAIGCSAAEIGATFVSADSSGVSRAQQELSDARAENARTPATIKEDIMSDWAYTKRLYEREASAELQIEMGPTGGEARREVIHFKETWSDCDVEGDPAHGVEGHQAARGPLNDSRELLAPIGLRMSATLAKKLTVALSNAALDQARKAFLSAGNEATKPGFEDVDAEAFSIAGSRLARVQLRSSVKLEAGTAIELPTASLALGARECLLAVAVAQRSENAVGLTLGTSDKRHGDARHKAKAAFEVCPGELGDDALPVLSLAAEPGSGGVVRWALYRTRQGEKAAP